MHLKNHKLHSKIKIPRILNVFFLFRNEDHLFICSKGELQPLEPKTILIIQIIIEIGKVVKTSAFR